MNNETAEQVNFNSALVQIQTELKAPKNQRNNFGGYNYRSCEDIMEAVKPLLQKYSVSLTVSDDIVAVGNRVYVKATATLSDGFRSISNSAFAREAESKKGMDEAQITGSASSYARKYALNGLFCIDDTKDPDATNTHGKDTKTPAEKAKETRERTKDAKETALEEARKWYSYCNKTAMIPLNDVNRAYIESTINLLNDYKLVEESKKLKDLYESKAEKDSVPSDWQ